MDNQLLHALKSMLQEEFQPIKNELKDLKVEFKELKEEFKELKEEQVKTNEHLDRLESKVDRVETKVDKLEQNQVEMKERLDSTYTRTGELSEFRTVINQKFEGVAKDIVAIEVLAGKNTTDIAHLKALYLSKIS